MPRPTSPRHTSSPIVLDIPQTTTAQSALNLSNTHPIVTRAKDDISKPVDHLTLHTTTTSPLPWSHIHALRDPNRHNYNADGSLSRYKACLMANGRNQQHGIDYDD
ncbi:hypothetical protein Tco_1353614 [Tanacetum coccineum]